MTTCPECGREIPYGNGVIRHGVRLHYWCAHSDDQTVERETRLPSGATA